MKSKDVVWIAAAVGAAAALGAGIFLYFDRKSKKENEFNSIVDIESDNDTAEAITE